MWEAGREFDQHASDRCAGGGAEKRLPSDGPATPSPVKRLKSIPTRSPLQSPVGGWRHGRHQIPTTAPCCPIAALSSHGSTAWCCYAVLLVQALMGGMPGLTFLGSPFSPFSTTPGPSSATPHQNPRIVGEFVGPSVPREVWTLVRGPPALIRVVWWAGGGTR